MFVGESKSAAIFLFGEGKAKIASCGDKKFSSDNLFVADSPCPHTKKRECQAPILMTH